MKAGRARSVVGGFSGPRDGLAWARGSTPTSGELGSARRRGEHGSGEHESGDRGSGDRGSVTAEFAAALPAVMLCLALCVGAIQAAAQQARLLDHAAAAARLLGRGDPAPQPPTGAARRVGSADGLLCVTVTAPSAVGGIGALGLTVSARSCVLDDTASDDVEGE